MTNRNIAPTKNNLRMVKDELSFAQQGYDLLDQKRNILVLELMKMVDQAAMIESQSEEILKNAYAALQNSLMETGRVRTLQLASSVHIDNNIHLKTRKIMGVALPVVKTQFFEHTPYFSPHSASIKMDVCIATFCDTLKLLGELAELKIGVMRLAMEVKKTIRKVNALEKVAIPNAKETIDIIQNRLEESERDMFVLMKSVKKYLENKEP
jgi:V/A-type H+-transporting ATPase subunit D